MTRGYLTGKRLRTPDLESLGCLSHDFVGARHAHDIMYVVLVVSREPDLWSQNPNFRLRLLHLNIFGSGSGP